jgi:antitoxin HicB
MVFRTAGFQPAHDHERAGCIPRLKKKGRIGSSFDDFLKDEGVYEEVAAKAIKRVIARQLGAVMRENHLTKSMLARRMRTSRAQLDRLLDPDNDSVTLGTLTRAAHAVGRNLRMELVQCEGLPCEAAPGGEAGA